MVLSLNEIALIENIKNQLSKKRFEHTLNVKDEAVKLAEKYGCSTEKAAVAALLHDICRECSIDKINKFVKEYKLDSFYLNNIALSHSKMAAEIIKNDYNIQDMEIINAVSFHSTGRENMSLLEKIVFIADATEKGRNYPGVEKLRALAYTDIDEACLQALNSTIAHVIEKNEYLDVNSVKARNYFLNNRNHSHIAQEEHDEQ